MKKKLLAFLSALTICMNLQAVSAFAEETEKEEKGNPNISSEYADITKASLFDESEVHTINLIITDENWNTLMEKAQDKEYVTCDIEVDGETIPNVAIRTKGNASLRSIGNRRDNNNTHYSFKIELDHFDKDKTYHGLDKIALNNLGQDLTCMKDFLCYHMMNDMGVNAPLASYTLLKKNGENFGLYLAVESVEDSFVQRHYGEDDVELYKPEIYDKIDREKQSNLGALLRVMNGSMYADKTENDRVDIFHDYWGGVFSEVGYTEEFETVTCLRDAGSNVEDYQEIWDESVFKCSDEDKEIMMNCIDKLNHGANTEEKQSVLDTDQLMRYFVVQTFVNNNDGLVGIMKHNYFLCEDEGKLSYVPWDYNLAFGGFHFENAIRDGIGEGLCLDMTPTRLSNIMSVEKNLINFPIDTPMYTGDNAQLPMLSAWLDTDEGKESYHKLYDEFIQKFENGDYETLLNHTKEIITPYVKENLTFYTAEQFENAVKNAGLYLQYRSEAIRGQLNGTIPATKEGQAEQPETLLEPEGLDTSAMTTCAGTASCPPPAFLNPIIKAFNGEDPDNSVGHFADKILAYYQNPTTMYDRIPELMQVNNTKGSAVKIINAKFGVQSLLFTQHGNPNAPQGKPSENKKSATESTAETTADETVAESNTETAE